VVTRLLDTDTPQPVLRWTYDIAGHLIEYGAVDGFQYRYELDPNGQVIRSFDVQSRSLDERYENSYDDSGQLARADLVSSAHGFAPLRSAFHYDATGRLDTEDLDRAIDGVVEKSTKRTYHRDCSLRPERPTHSSRERRRRLLRYARGWERRSDRSLDV
jgi:YD repeat-containing protein